jgi:hypothetical protein
MADPQEPSPGALANQNDELWKAAYEKFQAKDAELYERLQAVIHKDTAIKENVPQEHQIGALLARKRRRMEDQQWVLYWGKKRSKLALSLIK